MIQTQYNGRKSNFGPDLGPLGPNSGRQNFVSKIWLHQSLDNMVSYHQVKYLKKLMIHSLRKRSDGRTDGQTDESDFTGRCPTKVKCLKIMNCLKTHSCL